MGEKKGDEAFRKANAERVARCRAAKKGLQYGLRHVLAPAEHAGEAAVAQPLTDADRAALRLPALTQPSDADGGGLKLFLRAPAAVVARPMTPSDEDSDDDEACVTSGEVTFVSFSDVTHALAGRRRPRLRRERQGDEGFGVLALEAIGIDQLVGVYGGPGTTIIRDRATMQARLDAGCDKIMQVGEQDVWLDPTTCHEVGYHVPYINHRCECVANCRFEIIPGTATIILVAERDIEEGEYLTVDYGFVRGVFYVPPFRPLLQNVKRHFRDGFLRFLFL
jgi:hypothetical protein